MSMIQEFKAFAMKGNVVDMAVGVIIGGAFGKIVSALVDKILMPPLGMVIGGLDFSDMKLVMKAATEGQPEVAIGYGAFIQSAINFLIIAWALFMVIKAMNRMQRPAPPPAAPATSEDIVLLREIRDSLKK
ncbi:MAG: large-conductance mechanosensitive channel protein MscL [Bdellovibrionales bacterium]